MSYNTKRVIDMLENDFEKIVNKGDITPSDLAMLKDASKTMYYLTAYCAMKDDEMDQYSGNTRYGMPPHYYVDPMNRTYGENRQNYSGDNRRMMNGYSSHSKESKREFLEEMLREARTESEREMLRQKLNELDQMR